MLQCGRFTAHSLSRCRARPVNPVAKNIRFYAAQKSTSLDSVGDFAGVSRRQRYNFLSGEHDITLGWLARVAHALEVGPPRY